MDSLDTPVQMSSQTLSDMYVPEMGLAATETWDPRINPNPDWIHLAGISGMEHLVEAARDYFLRPPPITAINSFPENLLDGEATPPERAHLSCPAPRIGARPSWWNDEDIHLPVTTARNDEGTSGEKTPPHHHRTLSPARPDFMEPLRSSPASSPIPRNESGEASSGSPTPTS